MKHFLQYSLLFITITIATAVNAQGQLAFPGAEGGGAFVTGGRGGKTVLVTSLADDGSKGTLRWAVRQKGPRTIIFRVAGRIELTSQLFINEDNLTIAGESAPGDGITISNFPVSIKAENVIIRFLKFRLGDIAGLADDAVKAIRTRNLIIDHCSLSWGTDECGSFYDNENFTLQWCIVSESLNNSTHAKGAHGYGGIWGGKNASFHHNLIMHHTSRNPRFCGSRYSNDAANEKVEFRNNVIYNWGSNSAYAGEGGVYNIVNNYYKPGPATLAARNKKLAHRIFAPNADEGANAQAAGVWGKFYVSGNFVHGNKEVSTNNWLGVHPDVKNDASFDIKNIKLETAVQFHGNSKTAEESYNAIIKHVGASLKRDAVDQRLIEELKTGTTSFKGSRGSINGIIDSQADVGGWPTQTFDANDLPIDTDGDGLPDAWEIKNGLDINNPNDANMIAPCGHYSHLELYLHSLVSKLIK